MKKLFLGVLAWSLLGATAIAKEEASEAPKKCSDVIAHTVFIPDKSGNRQEGSAERLSEMHDKAESQGWNFEDLEVYIEDGDLQGFFVTYTKPSPCSKKG